MHANLQCAKYQTDFIALCLLATLFPTVILLCLSQVPIRKWPSVQKSRCGHQKSRISDSSCSRNNLSPSPMDWFVGDHRVEDFEFHVSDWLVAEGPLPRSPLESLYNGVRVLVDAEESRLQPAIHHLTVHHMMPHHTTHLQHHSNVSQGTYIHTYIELT